MPSRGYFSVTNQCTFWNDLNFYSKGKSPNILKYQGSYFFMAAIYFCSCGYIWHDLGSTLCTRLFELPLIFAYVHHQNCPLFTLSDVKWQRENVWSYPTTLDKIFRIINIRSHSIGLNASRDWMCST